MAAAFRSSNATTYASRTNTTITAPAGIQNGDVLLGIVLTGASTAGAGPPTPTTPAGFTLLTGLPTSVNDGSFGVKLWVWRKIAASESGNYTFTHTAASSQGYMCAVSGADTTTPINPNPTTNTGTFGPTTTATGLTTARDGSLVIFVSQDWGDTANALSPPTGTTPTFNERLDTTGTNAGILYVADGVLTTAGATGNKSITNNSSSSGPGSPWAGILIAVQPVLGTVAFQSRFMRQAVNRASTY